MNDIKRRFQQDFEQANHVDLSFDTKQLEPNSRKTKHRIKPLRLGVVIAASVVVALVGIPASVILFALIRTNESVKSYSRRYSMNEIQIAESNTFKKLNAIVYPSGSDPTKAHLTEEEEQAYGSFSNRTYHALVNASKNDNMSYAIAGLYSVMNQMSGAASRAELQGKLNGLLGLNEAGRVAFYEKLMNANSFAREESTTQLKNAAFFHREFNYSQEFVNDLSKLYCEAYQIDFGSEAGKIVEWVNQAVHSNGYIDERFLEMGEETELYLLSTLYFKNAWSTKYLSDNNVVDDFHLSNGRVVQATYMRHSYYSEAYYDYDTYISVKDYYLRGNASVTYLIPKRIEDDIFELTKEANIFEESQENKRRLEGPGRFRINLKTPKFTTKSEVDFQDSLKELGFADIFDKNIDSFKNAFDDERLEGYNIYIQKIKQKNEVEFNEDGSVVRSLTLGSLGAGSAAYAANDTLEVELNQPFIYIIRDINDTPIFVGHVDNPTLA